MAASLLSCLVSLGISFLITPTVIYKLGSEAQGFVTMANNFVSYAAIAAMALNSMAGRLSRSRSIRMMRKAPIAISTPSCTPIW